MRVSLASLWLRICESSGLDQQAIVKRNMTYIETISLNAQDTNVCLSPPYIFPP